MAKQIFLVSIFALVVAGSLACKNPEVTSKSFTTQDSTIVTHVAYISEFNVKCGSGEVTSLYAELEDGNVVPVAVVGPQTYQVSWTEESNTAKSGERKIRVFNEEGYTALRKAFRAGECSSTVEPFFTISLRHPGAYNGPLFKSEFVAAIAALLVTYFAISTRSKIVS